MGTGGSPDSIWTRPRRLVRRLLEGYRLSRRSGRKVRTPAAGRKTAGQRGSVAVTTFDAAAAWQKKKPLALALCAALMAFGLAGCETYNSLTSSLFSSSSDTPTASVSPAMQPAAMRPAQVGIAPIIGPPEAVSKDLQAQITSDLERQNIRVAHSPGEPSQYTLRGYIVSSMEKKGGKAKVSYIWDVTDGSGKGVHRDRKSTRLNSSHTVISYAVFCLKKKKHRGLAQSPHDMTLLPSHHD